MVRFLNPTTIAASISTFTPSANIWRYGMGSDTPDRCGVRVIQKHNSSHFRQEVVLARYLITLTSYLFAYCAAR